MFKPAEKTELCQISLTGMRSVMLLGLLIQAPRSLDEIRQSFLNLNVMEPDSSNDIIRIDLNTLKAIGCEISRADNQTNGKFNLLKHPFDLKITSKELNVVKKVYKKITSKAGLATLIEYDNLFRKLAGHIYDIDVKEQLLGISLLKSYNLKALKDYINDCKYNNKLTVEYKNPVTRETDVKTFIAQKIDINNEKIYLFGYNPENNESLMLPIKRIKSVLKRESDSNIADFNPVVVKFCLKRMNSAGLLENEKILETKERLSYIIEGSYNNEFTAVQRLLSFGAECEVLEPEIIRESVINKLLAMREVYKND